MRGTRVEVRLDQLLYEEWDEYLRSVRRTAQAELAWMIRQQVDRFYAEETARRLARTAELVGEQFDPIEKRRDEEEWELISAK